MKSENMKTLKKVMTLIGKYKIFLVLSIILAAISVMLQLYVPILFGDAIDQIIAKHQVNFTMIWYYLRQIIVCVAFSAVATWVMNMLNNRMTYRIVQDIRSQAMGRIQHLPLSYLDQHSTGDIVSGSQPTPIFCPMVSCLVLPSCFPES